MDDSEKLGLLSTSFGELLQSGLFSDLQVVCSDGTIHKVHKGILCARSRFFKNALNPQSNFVEAQANVMRLEHDDPAAVEALMQYCYRCDYTNPDANPHKLLPFHISVYVIGEKYLVQGLKRLAMNQIGEICSNTSSLEELDYLSAVKAIYENTAASDDCLRKLFVDIANDKFDDLMSIKEFSEMLGVNDQFNRDLGSLMLKIRQNYPNIGCYTCHRCRKAVAMVLPARTGWIHCTFCGKKGGRNHWKATKTQVFSSLSTYRCDCCRKEVSMSLRDDGVPCTHCISCGCSCSNRDWKDNKVL
ncbi:hypothetical protein BKA81DRAFT_9579 [Phyllosticta paracitricarpa]|uniref:BTB domain-containing protein n=2 Tax=Phyllosticta TaxID=121621 RepID=A0ABR1MJR7_9PEZI